jgi:hypothetical protein
VFIGLSGEGEHNLFALNVSQVVAGTAVSCDAPDPNCLLLTNHLLGSSADFHPTFFAGDTLVYYDETLTPHVWRPGMSGGRLLANRGEMLDIAFCTPSSRGLAVACLGLPFVQPDSTIVAADLYLGAADGESEPLLAPVDDVILAAPDDTESVQRFALGSPVSGYVAWSSREAPDGPEVLKVQSVDDPESQTTVASDVHRWDISADGSGWLWLRAVNEYGTGMLQTARFHDGADPVDVLDGVLDYEVNRSGALIARTRERNAVAIPDPIGAPGEQLLIDGEVTKLVTLSSQNAFAYAKRAAAGGSELLVSSLDGTRFCSFDTSGYVSLGSVQFAKGAETLLWTLSNAGKQDAFHSRLADCGTDAVAPSVSVVGWVGRSHVILVDDVDPATSSGTLRFRKIGKDGALHPDPPALIAEHVDTHATWGPDFLLYAITSGTEESGMYVRAFGE